MHIQCDCGNFKAELTTPTNTPGRLKCYCDDCQSYAHFLGRTDLLDVNGGSEVLPFYPSEIKILAGSEYLTCTQLSAKGPFRFSTTCCTTPILNARPGTPWMATTALAHHAADKQRLDTVFGPVRASIMGLYAKGTPPKGVPAKFNLKGFATVMPHMIRGSIFKKTKSPFFKEDGSPISPSKILTAEEKSAARKAAQA